MRRYTKRPKPLQDTTVPAAPARLPPRTIRGQITVELDGYTYSATILQPGYSAGRAPRSDQVSIGLAGEWQTMSLRAAVLTIAAQVPRRLSQRELTSIDTE